MNEYFSTQESCPCCKSTNSITLCKVSYTDSPIKEYLDSFYSPQGGVEWEYLQGAFYILEECKGCGLVYQKEIPNDLLMVKLYEEWIHPEKVFQLFEQNLNLDYYLALVNEMVNVIKYFNVAPRQLKVLDFGMGWGNWCRMAKGFGCDVYGTELSHVRLEYAKTSGINIITWDDMPKHQFDFIRTEQVFEHISEPLETFVHLKRSLKSTGIIKISVPNGWDIRRRLEIWDWKVPKGHKKSLNAVAPLEHINCYNYAALIKMAQSAGLTQVKIADNPTSIKGAIKIILKSYYNLTPRKSTSLFFRSYTDNALPKPE